MKGLFTLQMLIELQRYLPVELHNYFNWICGTSTGSMIATGLASQWGLKDIRKQYFDFKDMVMMGDRPYNDQTLVDIFKKHMNGDLTVADIKTKYNKHLLLTTSRVDYDPPLLSMFKSFRSDAADDQHSSGELSEQYNTPVWRALRASCAAPTYFRSFHPYIDGGLIANNPTLDSLVDFFRYRRVSTRKVRNDPQASAVVPPKLNLVVSFGAGKTQRSVQNLAPVYNQLHFFYDFSNTLYMRDMDRPTLAINEMFTQLKSQLTNCNDAVAMRGAMWCSSLNVPFYRINAPLSRKITLNETNDEILVRALWEIKIYATDHARHFCELGKVMEWIRSTKTISNEAPKSDHNKPIS